MIKIYCDVCGVEATDNYGEINIKIPGNYLELKNVCPACITATTEFVNTLKTPEAV